MSKKHKPNPETLQTRPSKSCSPPLGLEEQAHKAKTCPSKPREGTVEKEQGDGEQSQTKLGSTCGGGRWGSRQAAGRRVPTVGLGKERLANRLRLREVASAGTISDLRTSQEDLENTGDLQVRHRDGTLTQVDCQNCFFCSAISLTDLAKLLSSVSVAILFAILCIHPVNHFLELMNMYIYWCNFKST